MAAKANSAQIIRDYIAEHPNSTLREIYSGLRRQGVYISLQKARGNMQKKPSKQSAIEAYLKKHPDATSKQVIAALAKKHGVIISSQISTGRKRLGISPGKGRPGGGKIPKPVIPTTGAIPAVQPMDGAASFMDDMIEKLELEEAKLLERVEGIRQAKRVLKQG